MDRAGHLTAALTALRDAARRHDPGPEDHYVEALYHVYEAARADDCMPAELLGRLKRRWRIDQERATKAERQRREAEREAARAARERAEIEKAATREAERVAKQSQEAREEEARRAEEAARIEREANERRSQWDKLQHLEYNHDGSLASCDELGSARAAYRRRWGSLEPPDVGG